MPGEAEPAGGTTTRSSAGRAGRLIDGAIDGRDGEDAKAGGGGSRRRRSGRLGELGRRAGRGFGAGQGLPSRRSRARHLRVLARRRRLQSGRYGLPRRLDQAALRHHPAAAERDRLAPPRPRPALDGGRPDDAPCPNAGPARALPARPGPRLDRRPVRPRQDPRGGGRVPPDAGPREVPGADVAVRPGNAGDHPGPAATRRRLAGHDPPPVHDGRRLGPCGPRGVPAAVSGRAGVPDRGADPLVPRLPDQRLRPGGHPEGDHGQPLDDALPPDRRGDGQTRPERLDRRRHHSPGDPPRRHCRRGQPG